MKKTVQQHVKGLSKAKKVTIGFFGLIALIALFGSHKSTTTLNATNQAAHTTTVQPTKPAVSAQPAKPVDDVVTNTTTETQVIPFTTTTVNDANMAKGTTKVVTAGVDGSQTLTYQVTTTNGQQTAKTLVGTVVTAQPITQVTHVGTYVKSTPAPASTQAAANCDPNYSGACVPNVYPSDVDCAGGSGNGPYYVQGPVHVVGVDRYGLDRDGDGVACE